MVDETEQVPGGDGIGGAAILHTVTVQINPLTGEVTMSAPTITNPMMLAMAFLHLSQHALATTKEQVELIVKDANEATAAAERAIGERRIVPASAGALDRLRN